MGGAASAEPSEARAEAGEQHEHEDDGALGEGALEGLGELGGGALVLDLTQSLGAMTFELDQIRPDFAVAAAYKWLLGPYSTGLLYVDPRHHRGEPLELPIFSRKTEVRS